MANSLEMSVIGINGDPTSSQVWVSKYLTGPGLGSSNNKSKRGRSWFCKCSADSISSLSTWFIKS